MLELAGSPRTEEKFREWTRGRDAHGSIIAIFEQIRNIPYSLIVPTPEGTPAGERLLAAGRGSCGAKHYLLAHMYRKLGIEVVYATFPFLWDNPDLRYPPELRELSRNLPVAYHLACRARINNRWVLVDATWDPPLKQAGFPVNENWDGQSDTLCAVRPLQSAIRTAFCRTATNEPFRGRDDEVYHSLDGELDHPDEGSRILYTHEKTLLRTREDLEHIRTFFQKFDAWVEELRTSH